MSSNKSKVKEKTNGPIFKFSDAEFVKEFPGVLRCAIRCVNGINAEEDLAGSERFKGSIGMCHVYKGNDGHFVIFYSSDKRIITTQQGMYTNYKTFHSIRCDSSLFIFEEDFTRTEEALCATWDVSYYMHKLKEYVALSNLMSIFDNSLDHSEESE